MTAIKKKTNKIKRYVIHFKEIFQLKKWGGWGRGFSVIPD
jgi:hypothetical protein